MRKYRVENAGEFAAWPEANMGIHFGRDADDENSIYVVIGTEVAVELAQLLSGDGEFEQLPDWRETSFRDWLPRASKRLRPMGSATARAVFGYAVAPVAPLPAVPARPAVIYGHLPFTSVTTGFDRFYRWEPWPTSRKFGHVTDGYGNQVPETLDETFASPESELPLVPSGFAAVARNALPSLYPATTRYLLEPEAGQMFFCGPSVPLYGMAGGGVEVKFPKGTKLRRMPTSLVVDAL